MIEQERAVLVAALRWAKSMPVFDPQCEGDELLDAVDALENAIVFRIPGVDTEVAKAYFAPFSTEAADQ